MDLEVAWTIGHRLLNKWRYAPMLQLRNALLLTYVLGLRELGGVRSFEEIIRRLVYAWGTYLHLPLI